MKIKQSIIKRLRKWLLKHDTELSLSFNSEAWLCNARSEYDIQTIRYAQYVSKSDIESGRVPDLMSLIKNEIRYKIAKEVAKYVEIAEAPNSPIFPGSGGILLTGKVMIAVKKQ